MVRPAIKSDLADFTALMEASWEDTPLPGGERTEVIGGYVAAFERVVIQGSPGVCWISPRVGMVLWEAQDTETLAFPGIYVRPEWRGRGVASQLLEAACATAKGLGFKRIGVAPLAGPAVDWFNRRGFSPVQVLMTREI